MPIAVSKVHTACSRLDSSSPLECIICAKGGEAPLSWAQTNGFRSEPLLRPENKACVDMCRATNLSYARAATSSKFALSTEGERLLSQPPSGSTGRALRRRFIRMRFNHHDQIRCANVVIRCDCRESPHSLRALTQLLAPILHALSITTKHVSQTGLGRSGHGGCRPHELGTPSSFQLSSIEQFVSHDDPFSPTFPQRLAFNM